VSCGHHHETPCSSVLERVYEYIDNEMADDDCATVKEHLDECAPCLAEFGLEQTVKALVQRSCGCDQAPEQLRSKVLAKIRQVQDGLAADGAPPPAESELTRS
jgi:mycothiol system anti-sigma-R factor